ncbi:potassium channel subfamily K member 4 [Gadus chalcogrammus]|uniref:potassium channel subfamily K member 4 n=1 Tax=Gadus chalcogrammus TaxID=1042646 RepID=UPI0024C48F03|nr:potassium channel subfamily K member 4 [Gadus chalcogrammus]
MRRLTLLALLVGVMLYLAMGALVFRTLEAPQESQAYDRLVDVRDRFLRNHSHCVSPEAFNQLMMGMVSAVDAGLDLSSSLSNYTSNWDLINAFFFCGTIITTIGFGNLSPRTWFGQLFCVCYALVGIPMFGILLAGVSDHMGTVLRKAVARIETLFLERNLSPTIVRVSSAVISILIGCLIFLVVPTLVFQEVERWTFLESIYFVVITLTTVGFGDFVPGSGRDSDIILKPLVWLWIVFGLAYFASILAMIGKWLRVLSKRTRAEMEELRAHATDWHQNIQNMDFRIPNPLEFNDPFLLQRRRWKRSERRRVRRGAQATLGYLVRGGSENGHLRNRWPDLPGGSMVWLETSLPPGPGAKGPGGVEVATVPRAGLGLGGHPGVRSFARSLSLPVAHSTLRLDLLRPRLGGPGGPLSSCDSRSDAASRSSCSSCSSCSSGPEGFQPGPAPGRGAAEEEKLLDFFGENLAYIDESSDTLSDRAQPEGGGAEPGGGRPRKPNRKRSMRRAPPVQLSPLVARKRHSSDIQPPSNPPTPPPHSPL